MVEINVHELEGPGGDPARGSVPPATVPKLRYSHTSGVAGPAPTDGQVRPAIGD